MRLHRAIPNGQRAAAEARDLLGPIARDVPEQVLGDARIVLSELVTNTYRHSGTPEGTPIDVSVDLEPHRLRVEVIDRSIFDPTPETSQELRSAKWGLVLVDRLADSWGRISEGGVWAEFRTSQ